MQQFFSGKAISINILNVYL